MWSKGKKYRIRNTKFKEAYTGAYKGFSWGLGKISGEKNTARAVFAPPPHGNFNPLQISPPPSKKGWEEGVVVVFVEETLLPLREQMG